VSSKSVPMSSDSRLANVLDEGGTVVIVSNAMRVSQAIS